MTRQAGICLWAALLAVALSACAGGEPPAAMAPLRLTIGNDTDQSLRCTAVLAHFMSQDLGVVAPGARLSVPLRRDFASGALALAPREGRDVPLENLLCGLTGDWTGSRGELPLGALRADPAASFAARCGLAAGRVACRVEAVR
ncbi:MAG: hypothetical protein WD341_06940 [Tistlia sp.]|uniref:hypothetical protein n=1 Tax=Tistlia sp. TaxID=3057121 RepID=UPI0034A11F5D